MPPARHRMRRGSDFDLAVRHGRRSGRSTVACHLWMPPAAARGATSPGIEAASTPVQPSTPVLVGFVVSRAVGNAVVRNRVKRRLRALVARHLEALPAGSRLVVRATPMASTVPTARLEADLERVLARLVRADVDRATFSSGASEVTR